MILRSISEIDLWILFAWSHTRSATISQNRSHSPREANRCQAVSDVFRLVFGQFERFRVRYAEPRGFIITLKLLSIVCSLGTGSSGPAFFGLGLKQSLIILLIVDVMYVSVAEREQRLKLRIIQIMRYTCVFVSALVITILIFGDAFRFIVLYSDRNSERDLWCRPATRGGRLHATSLVCDLSHGLRRFRYFGAILPSALNVFTMQGFLILNCIIGVRQSLACLTILTIPSVLSSSA